MVRGIVAAVVVLFIAIPALAQDEFPRIEMSLGYANAEFPSLATFQDGRRSGFSSTQAINLTRIFGLENYFGYYGLGAGPFGNKASLIANMFGGKVTARTERANPYFTVGLGVGYITDEINFGGSSFATKWGPGVDFKLNDMMGLKIDFSRMSFHLGEIPGRTGTWHGGWNISTGVMFTLSQ